MDLAYCKQCGRRVPDEEIEFGEAHVAGNGDVYCNTCAIGLGLEVAVKAAPPKRRRRSRAMAAPARRGSAWPLLVLVAVILVGAGIPTALYILLSSSREVPVPPAASAPTEQPVTPGPGAPGPPPRETPAVGQPEAPPETPRILTPAEVRALARAEFEKLKARSAEIEKAGRLVEAMDVYIEFPFKYRHTEYHSKAQAERRRLEVECEAQIKELDEKLRETRDPFAASEMISGAWSRIDATAVRPRLRELRQEFGGRLAATIGRKLQAGEAAGLPVSVLIWQTGKSAAARWSGKSAAITFADAEEGRGISTRLPRRVTWDLSRYEAISFSMPRCPERATFVLEIETGAGMKSSAPCNREAGRFTADLGSLVIDLAAVRRISLTLAEPVGQEVAVEISGVSLTKK